MQEFIKDARKKLQEGYRTLRPQEIVKEGDISWVWTDSYWEETPTDFVGLTADHLVLVARKGVRVPLPAEKKEEVDEWAKYV
jgi:hypothetical protein